MVEEVTTFTDSDWAGCQETRKSSSAGVVMLGSHTWKAYTCEQKIIARSSAEVEPYAAALGTSESKGIASLLRDLEYKKNPVLAIDTKATEHILHRQGIGKLKHIDRVRSEESVVDLGTKALSKAEHSVAQSTVSKHQAKKIASVEQIEVGNIMELSITGQVLKWARQSSLSGGLSLRKADGWNLKNHSHLIFARHLRDKIHPSMLVVTIREGEERGICSAALKELLRIVKDQPD